MLDPASWNTKALDETRVYREYIVGEAQKQYRDYYETDDEEQPFFEFMDAMTNRDKIRLMEVFKDYTSDTTDQKDYMMI